MRIVHVAAAADLPRLFPVVEALRRTGRTEQTVVLTGAAEPNHNPWSHAGSDPRSSCLHLGIGPAAPAVQTGRALIAMDGVLRRHAPDWMVSIGATPPIVGAALAAAQLGVRSARLEAGLRTHEPGRPEDLAAAVADRTACALFASEPAARENLLREGMPPAFVHLVGSLTIDALDRGLAASNGLTPARDDSSGRYVLVLLEGDQSQGAAGLGGLFRRLADAVSGADAHYLVPVSPALGPALHEAWKEAAPACVRVVAPVTEPERLALLAGAGAVLTDGGPAQEEAAALGIPCLVLGRSTDRPLTVTRGTTHLVGIGGDELGELLRAALASPRSPRRPRLWDGRAAERVAARLVAEPETAPL